MEDQEIINEFLIESTENLAHLEQEIVELEQRPGDSRLLAGIFRTIHTIKGTCGFLSFSRLESVTHIAENLLSQLRSGKRSLDPGLTSLILETVDAVRKELAHIESGGKESGELYEDLRRRLTLACDGKLEADNESPAEAAKPETEGSPVVPEGSARENGGVEKTASVADSTIRVDVGLLDKLMNLVGELVLARNQILQFSSRQEDAGLNSTAQRLNLITTQLQEGVMKTRMQPIGVIWNKLPRVVRDLAASFNKQIELEMDGADTELDKTIIEAIKDPLTHIVRNCCDHGLEYPEARLRKGKPAQGKLILRAFHEGGQVNIEIADDGGGIDLQKVKGKALKQGLVRAEQIARMSDREILNLIFLPGFSTAAEVTSVSGRGVGLDVVRTNVEKIGGVVDLVSRLDQGTTIKLKIPLTLAIIPGLVVTAGENGASNHSPQGRGERFVIPQVSLLELIRLEGDSGKQQIELIHDTPFYRRRGRLLPIVYLARVLKLGQRQGEQGPLEHRQFDQRQVDQADDAGVVNIVVLQAEDRQFGLVVDGINDTQEIVVKPLGKQLKGLSAYAGATIMGDGKVALILDVLGIGQLSGVLSESREESRTDSSKSDASHQDHQAFLLFRAGKFERLAVPLSLVARLEEFPGTRIERAGGKLVVQYREQILQLKTLSALLENGQEAADNLADPAQVIVFSQGDHMAGLVVDQILDIHEESIRMQRQGERAGLSGSAVIGGKVTDFLDLSTLMRAADEKSRSSAGPHLAVLVADPSAFSRGLVRNYLELAGHAVVEASDQSAALRLLDQHQVTAVVLSRSLASGGRPLVEEMRKHPAWKHIPIVALGDLGRDTAAPQPGEFDACVDLFDRLGLLQSLRELSAALEESREVAPAGSR